MNRLTLFVLFFTLASCQSTKQTTTETKTQDENSGIPGVQLYFKGTNTLTLPNDEFTIDTGGQVLFISQQQMSTGNWREPKGIAYLEPDDRDTIALLLLDDVTFTIKNQDVNMPCADGALITLRVHRTDGIQSLNLQTSTCATEYNTLFGQARKNFKILIPFLQRIRDKYRPMYLDKKKYNLE